MFFTEFDPAQWCDFTLQPSRDVYACTRCGFTISRDDYANEIHHHGHYTRDCAGPRNAPTKGKRCAECGGEWCEYLDAYYGMDAWAAKRCAKCRSSARKAS